jgi:DNA-binding MarR family transcriptional regulator
MTAWLDADETRAWRGCVEVLAAVQADLEDQLVADHGITAGDYGVLVHLSEAPEQAMRMCDLAARLHLSPSGLTRRLDGMVRAGLVARHPSSDDRRVMLAVLTAQGRDLIERAAPGHVEAVRRHFLDHLTRRQLVALGEAFDAVRAGRDVGAASR